MKNKNIYVIAFAVVIMLVCTSVVKANPFPRNLIQDEMPGENQTQSTLGIATLVSNSISYQGVLEENGVPVSGDYDMDFGLYSDDSCLNYVDGLIGISDVPVEDGLFSVQIGFEHSSYTGQALYLMAEVEGTALDCQEILPVPYALSLRPGAVISTESIESYAAAVTGEVSSTSPGSYSAGLRGINKGTGGTGIGVYGSQDGWGWGVFGQVDGDGKGVFGKANGANGIGVYAEGSGSSGTAFAVSSGGIRVVGAGSGTNTPVFIHQVTLSNITCTFSQCTEIDHPLTNGDSSAILFITQSYNPGEISGAYNPHPVGVQYNGVTDRWLIYNQDNTAMPELAYFNVMVVKP